MERSKSIYSDHKKDRPQVWYLCGLQTSRSALVFVSQITILYISIITCFINLSLSNGPSELWIAVLSLSIGSILPSPKVKKSDSGGDLGEGGYFPAPGGTGTLV